MRWHCSSSQPPSGPRLPRSEGVSRRDDDNAFGQEQGRSAGASSVDQKLVDEIYECSFAPELWPNVLDRLARIADAVGGTFFVASSTRVQSWTASEPLRAGIELFAKSDLVTRGGRSRVCVPPSMPASCWSPSFTIRKKRWPPIPSIASCCGLRDLAGAPGQRCRCRPVRRCVSPWNDFVLAALSRPPSFSNLTRCGLTLPEAR
jgi:hypothetical protein